METILKIYLFSNLISFLIMCRSAYYYSNSKWQISAKMYLFKIQELLLEDDLIFDPRKGTIKSLKTKKNLKLKIHTVPFGFFGFRFPLFMQSFLLGPLHTIFAVYELEQLKLKEKLFNSKDFDLDMEGKMSQLVYAPKSSASYSDALGHCFYRIYGDEYYPKNWIKFFDLHRKTSK